MEKILIDTSILGVGKNILEEKIFKPAKQEKATIVLLSPTMEEIENLHNKEVSESTSYDIRKLMDFFAKDVDSKYTELHMLENVKGHIDRALVEYAKNNNCKIMTADNGMCVWCRFYQVPFERLEHKNLQTELKYIREFRGSYYIYLREVPFGASVFVITPSDQMKKDDGAAHIPIDIGDYILTATLKDNKCLIAKYIVEEEEIKLVSEEYFSDNADYWSEKLYQKWCNYMKK